MNQPTKDDGLMSEIKKMIVQCQDERELARQIYSLVTRESGIAVLMAAGRPLKCSGELIMPKLESKGGE